MATSIDDRFVSAANPAPRQKPNRPPDPGSVSSLLKHPDRGLSVEEARAAMVAAGEAPQSVRGPVQKVNTPEELPEPMAGPEPEVIAAPAPVPTVAPVKEETERVENGDFIAEIKRENGQWVAAIQYKNSNKGVEKFIADTKTALMLKLLEGKGNATLRVNKAVREARVGQKPDLAYTWNPEDLSQADYDAMDAKNKKIFIQNIEIANTIRFRDSHPEYLPTDDNSKRLQNYLLDQGWPCTDHNLDIAYRFLLGEDSLDVREAPIEQVSVLPVAPRTVDSVPAAPPTPVSTVVPAPAAPAAVTRKRGTTGLRPGFSSATEDGLEAPSKPNEPSEAELRKMSIKDLRRIAVPSVARVSTVQR